MIEICEVCGSVAEVAETWEDIGPVCEPCVARAARDHEDRLVHGAQVAAMNSYDDPIGGLL